MNELAQKIAELFDVSVESVAELYPTLRSQHMWYRVFGGLEIIFVILFILLISVTLISGYSYYHATRIGYAQDAWFSEQKRMVDRKTLNDFKIFLMLTILSGVIMYLSFVMKGVLAPDWSILKEFMF